MFKPSIDWGNQPALSAWWILCTWTISAAVALLIGFVLIRSATWGRRFWYITGDYFTGKAAVRVWAVLALLLLSVVVSVRMAVLLSYYSNDLYSALQVAFQGASAHNAAQHASGVHGFWVAIVTFCVLATFTVARIVLDTYLTQRFIIRWRVWLTERLSADWLSDHTYYRGQFVEPGIDNPDQRIQQDIDVFTTGVGTGPNVPTYYSQSLLPFGAVNSVISVASFTVILWKLSGSLTLFGLTLPKALFWIVIAYVLIASVVSFRIGRPLIALSYRNEQANAAFRYAMIRLRDAAEPVAFYRGQNAEGEQLQTRFAAVIDNYREYVRRTLRLIGWNYSVTQAITPLPFLIQAPRLFAGAIKLGDVTQSATSFGKIESGLSFFRNAYSQFASYDAVIVRLHGLVEANERARQLPTLTAAPSIGGAVRLDGIDVRLLDGGRLIDALEVVLESGDSLLITGSSGTGKTTLLRSLAGLWPAATGRWYRPAGDGETMFLPQSLYAPLGDLRSVVSYPLSAHDVGDERLREVLTQVFLHHLGGRLDEVQDWTKVLSPGEQQRIAFARVLLARPHAVFLDEATSALDEGLEIALYRLLRAELPDSVVVSVSHHGAVEQHHQRHLELLGGGGWQLSDLRPADN